jgi:hypothetical protein
MSDSRSPLHGEVSRLIHGHLDGCLSTEEETRLGGLVATDWDVALGLARAAMVHDRLRDLFREELSTADRPAPAATSVAPAQARRSRRWLTALLAVAVALTAAVVLRPPTGGGVAAAAAIDRLVAAASSPGDREYRVTVLDHGPAGPAQAAFSGGRGRKPGIDGASLFVRGADRFVLRRRFGDGTPFITGCDGTIGWAVPPKGHVHLSHDPRRFRRGVPGEHEDLPFLDLRSGFDGLRRGYDLTLTEPAAGNRRLDARRRGHGRPGPDVVRVWFDEAGVATRIEIEGLAVEEGMPHSVALTLVSTHDLGAEFYTHQMHHAVDRPLDWE